MLGPLIVWLVKRGDSPELDAHGKEALNFRISMLIYNCVAAVFCLVLVGFGILWSRSATGDSEVDAAWEDEIERRIRSIDADIAKSGPFSEVVAELDRQFGR